MAPRIRAPRIRLWAAALAASAPGVARGDASLGVEPTGTISIIDTTDNDRDTTTRSRNDTLDQRYRLSLAREFTETLRAGAGGLLQLTDTWATREDLDTRTKARLANVYGDLVWQSDTFTAGADYRRRQQVSRNPTFASRTLTNEVMGGYGSFTPDGPPRVNLRLDHQTTWDARHAVQDQTSNSVKLDAFYDTPRPLTLQYALGYADTADRVHHLDLSQFTQTTSGSYMTTLWEDRVILATNAAINHGRTSTEATGATGTTATQQYPLSGLSLVERFPATPASSTLIPNTALADGNLSASANIDLGYNPSRLGDTANRHFGAEFSELAESVNTVYVWVDRTVPVEVASAFVFSVYSSNDNVTWQSVALGGSTIFADFADRFEVSFNDTRARFLKVVARPLPANYAAFLDVADVNVTEVQFFSMLPVRRAPTSTHSLNTVVNASARTRLMTSEAFFHELTLSAANQLLPERNAVYQARNGLSYSRNLLSWLGLGVRAARLDTLTRLGHDWAFDYSSSLAGSPVANLNANLGYSGAVNGGATRSGTTNSLTLSSTAELYPGVAAGTSAFYNFAVVKRRRSAGPGATVSVSLAPHPTFTLTSGLRYSLSDQWGAGLPRRRFETQGVDASTAFAPISALYLAANVTRSWATRERPRWLGNYSGGFSPFPGGALQLHFSYAESVDALSRAFSRTFSPSLHWRIAPKIVTNATYTLAFVDTEPIRTRASTFACNLMVVL
ncbi:MAG: hypothetical protein HY903_09890 [Deltaproteobacteria bacterium]|nr:hypothetical protein [Deltaproteobacteria bacterium]